MALFEESHLGRRTRAMSLDTKVLVFLYPSCIVMEVSSRVKSWLSGRSGVVCPTIHSPSLTRVMAALVPG